MSDPTLATLKDLLTEARYFVEGYQYQTYEEQIARDNLLKRIDEALPLPPTLADACEKDLNCFQANGHEGECDVSIPY